MTKANNMKSEKKRKEQRRQRKSAIRGRERIRTLYVLQVHGKRDLTMRSCTEVKVHLFWNNRVVQKPVGRERT